tara:strand:+ start:204 stop:500 length:297 start_codon:yes stop_codon:yes gene_type:complete
MIKLKPLSKKIVSKMSKQDYVKYNKLKKEHIQTGENMVRIQAEAVIYSRKLLTIKEPTKAQKDMELQLNDRGFKAMHNAFQKTDELRKFLETMQKKYM